MAGKRKPGSMVVTELRPKRVVAPPALKAPKPWLHDLLTALEMAEQERAALHATIQRLGGEQCDSPQCLTTYRQIRVCIESLRFKLGIPPS
jgi:hypothetical protein